MSAKNFLINIIIKCPIFIIIGFIGSLTSKYFLFGLSLYKIKFRSF